VFLALKYPALTNLSEICLLALQVYKDGNHKPEMAIAISDNFSALCGFAAQGELLTSMKTVPELEEIIGNERVAALTAATTESEQQAALKSAFTALMTADPQTVGFVSAAVLCRISLLGGIELNNILLLYNHKEQAPLFESLRITVESVGVALDSNCSY
jgi:mannose-6-phosphate isomerase class I